MLGDGLGTYVRPVWNREGANGTFDVLHLPATEKVHLCTGAPDQDGKDKTTAILFFREHHFTGSALKPSIFVDDKEVNRLSNGRWFLVKVEPGKHKLQSSAKNEPATIVDVAAGETAYVQMVILTGNWRGGGRLVTVDSKEAQTQVAKLKPLDEKDHQ